MFNLLLNLFLFILFSSVEINAETPITVLIKSPYQKMLCPSSPSQIDSDIRWSNENELETSQETIDFIMSRESRSCKEFNNFVGSNLFDGDRKTCFSPEDVNVLTARRGLELAMMPRDMNLTILDDRSVCTIMRYFCYGHLLIRRLRDCSTSRILKKAFFDAFGGFMHYYLLPVVKVSFYAGDVQLKTVRKVINYYKKCRFFLNTNGNGWRSPLNVPLKFLINANLKPVPPIHPNSACEFEPKDDYCRDFNLLLHGLDGGEDEDMIVALPKVESENNGLLGNIWLPFSRKTTFNLRSCNSAFILVGFYKKVSQCYWQMGIAQGSFDKKFRQWIANNILSHLNDEVFYPSLGGLVGLYNYLLKVEKCSSAVQKTNFQDPPTNLLMKRDRRRTAKYNVLANKVKSDDECEVNWLQEINKFSESRKKGIKKTKERNKAANKQRKYKKKMEKFSDFEEWLGKGKKKSKGKKIKEKDVDKDKRKKKKSFFKWNWRKWFKSGNSSSSKKRKNRKKKSFFNWSWPKWFKFSELDWSLKWGWVKLMKNLLMYGIILLLAIIALCVLCKLISLIAGILCGVGGSIGGDCFGIMINSIFGFLKKVFQVLAVFFTCSFATLCNWCGNWTANSSQSYHGDFEKYALPEIRIHSEPSTPNRSKTKKSRNSSGNFDHSEVSKELKTKRGTPKTESAKSEDSEGKTGRRSLFCKRKRRRAGRDIELETSTDSSPSGEEKTSWQTFYDF